MKKSQFATLWVLVLEHFTRASDGRLRKERHGPKVPGTGLAVLIQRPSSPRVHLTE